MAGPGAALQLGAKLFSTGMKARRQAAAYRTAQAELKPRREMRDAGIKLMQSDTGIGTAGAEAIRARGTQSLLGATRGLEAESRRGMANVRGGSQLATLGILAKTRAQGLTGIESDVTDADAAARRAKTAKAAQMISSAGDVTPGKKPEGVGSQLLTAGVKSIAGSASGDKSKGLFKAGQAGGGGLKSMFG